MTEETLEKLTINYLTEEQYNEALANGKLDENQLYMTPDSGVEESKRIDLTNQITYRTDITYSSKELKLYKYGKVLQLVGFVQTQNLPEESIIAYIPSEYITDIIRFFGVGDSGACERFEIRKDGTIICYTGGYWKGFTTTWITG